MLLATDIAALDHHEGTVTLIANAVNWDDSPRPGRARLRGRRRPAGRDDRGARARSSPPAGRGLRPHHRRGHPADHLRGVPAHGGGRPRSTSGPATPSRSCCRSGSTWPPTAGPLDIYRMLRATNPSPYMYLLQLPAAEDGPHAGVPTAVVGSSPEALVTVRDGHVTMHPIAGTRPRGGTDEDDVLLAKDLLADEKERSEHVMLVDLGRNDLGRVCRRRHRQGRRLLHHRAVQPRHAHRLDRDRHAGRRPDRLRRADRLLPGRHAVRGAEAAGHADHRRPGAGPARASTAASSATWISPATPTPRSPSGPRWSAATACTCRPVPAWSPTRCPPTRTPSAGTRRPR